MGIDIPQSDNSAFDDTAMERVQAIEYLPFSQAFEHIMYDNRIVRHAEHSMTKPIYLLPELIETPARFPQEIAQYFPSSNCIIENLHTSISDSLDEPRRVEIDFTADGKRHTLNTSEDQSLIYTVETYGVNDITQVLDPDVATKLLAALVYARQYDPHSPNTPIGFAESQLDLPRDPETSLIEQLIMTLGHHDGVSTITTTSLFHTPSGDMMMARLSEGEYPDLSSIQSKLALAELTSIDVSTETDLHQNVVNTQHDQRPVTLEKRFAEQHIADTLTFIDPESDYEQWSVVCDKFLAAIEDDLQKYAHLDDTVQD